MVNENQKGIIEAQVISKILQEKNWNFVEKYNLSEKHFSSVLYDEAEQPVCTTKEIFKFIKNHKEENKNIPDITTVLSNFPDFTLVEVSESEDYLVKNLKKNYNIQSILDTLMSTNKELIAKGDESAFNKLKAFIEGYHDESYDNIGLDLIHEGADKRLETYLDANKNHDRVFISSGLKELDDICGGGFYRSGDSVAIQARAGQSKTFLLIKFLYEAWLKGENVALYEPEMDSDSIGYRLDSLIDRWSSFHLRKGDVCDKNYQAYIQELKRKPNKFFFLSQKEFGNSVTVTKLKEFCKANKIGILGIDGIDLRYITDEKAGYKTPSWTQIGDILYDLLEISKELKMPVISVIQAKSVGKDIELDIDTVSGSYDISKLVTLMLTMKKEDKKITLKLVKNRNSEAGASLSYLVDLDKGIWQNDTSNNIEIKSGEGEVRQQSDISEDMAL